MIPRDRETSQSAMSLQVAVPLLDRGYQVRVGEGLLGRVGAELRRQYGRARRVALVSDSNVMPLYGPAVSNNLRVAGFEVVEIMIPAGERSKNPGQLFEVIAAMLDGRLDRNDVVVALGGGVVGDLSGLAASLFMRGIAFVQCPTSLLAQVDASVGGKVAVDLEAGKNLIGAFHFPGAVFIDPGVLRSLPDGETACGLAEMLKHGALFSADHFHDLVRSADAIYAGDEAALTRLISASVALKAACVGRDPLERGESGAGRVVLNLGHTVGHAIEKMSNFACKHGEAVALGLVASARISDARQASERSGGRSGGGGAERLEPIITEALVRLRLPVDLSPWLAGGNAAVMESALAADKKRSFSHLSYIVLRQLGEPGVVQLTAAEIVALLRAS